MRKGKPRCAVLNFRECAPPLPGKRLSMFCMQTHLAKEAPTHSYPLTPALVLPCIQLPLYVLV